MTVFGKKRGKIRIIFLVSLFIILILQWNCSFGQAINKSKFIKLNVAALAIKKAIAEGAFYQQVAERVQLLSNEMAAAKDTVSTREERKLLKAYSDLLQIYRDGLLLWRYQMEFPFLSSELKGRIYVGQDVEPIVHKYRLTTKIHLYKPTGQYWKSIDEDSILIIWHNADDQLEIIKTLANW
jgi:hypothetical protein